jgi:hypothetical protein
LWAPDEDEDTIMTEDKVRWESSITLTKDGVVGTGIFEDDTYYSIVQTDSGRVVLITINGPIEIDLDLNEIIEIFTQQHGGSDFEQFDHQLSEYTFDEIMCNERRSFNFTNFNSNYDFQNNVLDLNFKLAVNSHVCISLISQNGQIISNLVNSELKSDMQYVYQFDLANELNSNGQYYFVFLVDNNKRFSIPIIFVRE